MFDLTTRGEIAFLRLNRPEVRNAIPLAGWTQLGDRVEEGVSAGARTLVLAVSPTALFAPVRTCRTSAFLPVTRPPEPASGWRSGPAWIGFAMQQFRRSQ
jgi:hypothetical protein